MCLLKTNNIFEMNIIVFGDIFLSIPGFFILFCPINIRVAIILNIELIYLNIIVFLNVIWD